MSSTHHPTNSPSNLQLIINALGDYANLTGIDLSKHPFAEKLQLSTSPDSILELLRERETAFKEYRDGNRTLINTLSPAVQVLHAFSDTLGEALSLVPFPPAKAVFVGIDVLLAAASGVTSSYDALLELFESFGNFLKRLEIYTKIPPTQIMTEIIIQILAELLSVLALATKQIKQGRFKKFAKRLLGGDSEVEDVLHRLDRLTQDEARMGVAQTLGVVHGLVNNMRVVMEDGKASGDGVRQTLITLHRMVNDMNKIKRNLLQRDVQHWLSPPDPSTNHDFVWEAHHTGTAKWFLESKVLSDWKANGSLLWIHGKPGSGKSTLLSAIIEDIEGMRAAGLVTMVYYYFDFRDSKKQTRYGLLSSLLSQLSAESDSCYEILSQLYSKNAQGTRKPTSIALTKCLKEMLSSPRHGRFYLIVDALDECPNVSGTPSAREQVLNLVEELAVLNLPNVRLCVASRPEADIRRVLEPLTSLQISLHDETGQKADIIEYIKSVVHSDRSMQKWREEDQRLIIEALSDRADGMFRWVVCQVDRLRRAFPASLRSILADLPPSLDETYEQTLLGIDREKRKYAQRLFRCLMASVRPLRVEELAAILAVRFDVTGPPTYNPSWRPADARDAVLSACSSLISVVNKGGLQVVQFSHFSVKEFLTSERLAAAEEHLSYYHILPEPAHTILAQASLGVLLQLDNQIDRNTISHFPLAEYAAQYWVDHARFRNVSSHLQDVVERLFDPDKPHFAAWVWLHDIDHHWVESMQQIRPTEPEAIPLYYASLCGFRDLVEHLLVSHSSDVNCRGGSHTTPLHAASVKGHLEVALLLLKKGADPNVQDYFGRGPLHKVAQAGHLVIRESLLEVARLLIKSGTNVDSVNEEGDTPLHIAARNGHRDIVELLLESGASSDWWNANQRTPLYLACGHGRLDVALFLLDRGSDMNSRDKDDWTPFHVASRYGHVDIVHLLIDRSADVNVTKSNRWTPLHLASSSGHFHVAALLIQHGATVDSRNNEEGTPLDRAAKNGHLDIARLLVERGAAISSQDIKGWTPLHTASKFGHLHVVKFLLECGVDVDIRNGNDESSLVLASGSGKLDIVRFLIDRGADIDGKNNRIWNTLHIASRNGHLDVVQLLIDSGMGVDVRDGTGATPLASASGEGKVEVSRFLIERGADINTRDNQSWALLHISSRHGHLDMVQLLLDSGVDVDIQTGNLWTPLHLSSANGHLEITRLLIQHGATVDALNDNQQTPLDRAAGNGKVEIAHLLIDHEANVDATDSEGHTPLHSASLSGHLEVVKLLLRRGADLDVPNKGSMTAIDLAWKRHQAEVARFLVQYKADASVRKKVRSTTLDTTQHGTDASIHTASEEGRIDVVKSLLGQGVDINLKNEMDWTPLDRAATKGQLDVVQFLIKQGAEVDSCGLNGWTPLHKASRYGHLEVSRVLIEHGANINARQYHNWTPIHLSAGNGHLEIVQLLLERGADVHVTNDDGQTPYEVSLGWGYRKIADLLREHGACGG